MTGESLPNPPVPSTAAPETPECHGDVCVTCSDRAVPVRVVRLLGDDLALVDTGVSHEEVSVAFVEAAAGDTVLVHAKEAIRCLPGKESKEGGGNSGSTRGNVG